MFVIETDGSGQSYVNVGNLRLTLVEKSDGWAGAEVHHYLRIQAYKGAPGESGLQIGAEYAIRSPHDLERLAAAMLFLSLERLT